MPTAIHAKVKLPQSTTPYPGKLPVRTRTPEPAPRPTRHVSVVRHVLKHPEREPTLAEKYPGPRPPQRTRSPVPPPQVQAKSVTRSQTEPDMKKLYTGPKIPERTRPPEPPARRKQERQPSMPGQQQQLQQQQQQPGPKLPERTRPPEPPTRRRSSFKKEKQPSVPGPRLPERTRDPVPPPPHMRGGSVKKVMSILGRSSRSTSSSASVSSKQSQPRARLGSESTWDDRGSGSGIGYRPYRRVSWYSSRASPSSNSMCDLSVCDMACGSRHGHEQGVPSVPSLRSGETSYTTSGSVYLRPDLQDRPTMIDDFLLTPEDRAGLGEPGLDPFEVEPEPKPKLERTTSRVAGLKAVGAQNVVGALSHLSLSAVRAPSLKKGPMESSASLVSSMSPRSVPRSSIGVPHLRPEDISMPIWGRDGATSPASVPMETDSESEPDDEDEPSVTIFPRGSSRLSRAPSVVISEHDNNDCSPPREPSASARSRYSNASAYSTAMSGYSTAMSGYSTAMTGYSTAYVDFSSPASPASSGDGYGSYNAFGAAPVTTSYNQFGPPLTAVNYTAAGRQRPSSWHLSGGSSPNFAAPPTLAPVVPERDANFLQPPDMHYIDDLQPVGPRPSIDIDIKQGFRVEFDEVRRGRPF